MNYLFTKDENVDSQDFMSRRYEMRHIFQLAYNIGSLKVEATSIRYQSGDNKNVLVNVKKGFKKSSKY